MKQVAMPGAELYYILLQMHFESRSCIWHNKVSTIINNKITIEFLIFLIYRRVQWTVPNVKTHIYEILS